MNAVNEIQHRSTTEQHRQLLPRCSQRDHDEKFGKSYVRGQGAKLWDESGNDYIDFTCGYSVTNLGHCFEPIVTTAQQQLQCLTHLTGEVHPGRVEVARALIEVLWKSDQAAKVLFNSGGARAIESAWKAAVAFRPGRILSFELGFHGLSLATSDLSRLTGGSSRCDGDNANPAKHYLRWPAEKYPYCQRCPWGKSPLHCEPDCADEIEQLIESEHHSLSAILIEPALGSRGYIFPPPEFFCRLVQTARKHGVLVIADEIQTGLGRCGNWALSRLQGWHPDLFVVGKSLGGGIVPVSAVVGRADILDSIPAREESETFAATPFACNIALKVLEVLRAEKWMRAGEQLGHRLRAFLQQEFAAVRNQITPHERGRVSLNVEGVGAVAAMQWCSPEDSQISEARAIAHRFAKACVRERVLMHATGPQQTRSVFLPPLTLSEPEFNEAQQRLHRAFQSLVN